MKKLLIIMSVFVMYGCTGSGSMEEQILKLRSELSAEMKQSDEAIKNDYKRDLAVAQQTLQSDIINKNDTLKKELDMLRELHVKEMKEANITLIDIQKDFFQNRRLTEDNARRVYIIESLIAATRSTPEEERAGEIVQIKGNDVTTSLGSKHGIKAGDLLAVYKDNSSREKLATIRIMVTETNQSKGEIVEENTSAARGNVVRPVK